LSEKELLFIVYQISRDSVLCLLLLGICSVLAWAFRVFLLLIFGFLEDSFAFSLICLITASFPKNPFNLRFLKVSSSYSLLFISFATHLISYIILVLKYLFSISSFFILSRSFLILRSLGFIFNYISKEIFLAKC
jgi:hypothetical protein